MMVHDGHLGRPISGPSESDAPLVIDPDGVKARQIAPERFQTVAGRNGKVAEDASLIHPDQLSQRDPGHGREAAAASVVEQLGGLPVREGLNQAERASRGIADRQPTHRMAMHFGDRVAIVRSPVLICVIGSMSALPCVENTVTLPVSGLAR